MANAYVLINTDVAAETEVLAELKSFPEVKEAYLTYGVYDLIALLESDDFEDIKEGVLEQIRTLEKIRSTVTMIVAKEL